VSKWHALSFLMEFTVTLAPHGDWNSSSFLFDEYSYSESGFILWILYSQVYFCFEHCVGRSISKCVHSRHIFQLLQFTTNSFELKRKSVNEICWFDWSWLEAIFTPQVAFSLHFVVRRIFTPHFQIPRSTKRTEHLFVKLIHQIK
jgi:hypothetical protein